MTAEETRRGDAGGEAGMTAEETRRDDSGGEAGVTPEETQGFFYAVSQLF